MNRCALDLPSCKAPATRCRALFKMFKLFKTSFPLRLLNILNNLNNVPNRGNGRGSGPTRRRNVRPSQNTTAAHHGPGPKHWPGWTPLGCRQTSARSGGRSSSMTVVDFSTRDGQPTLMGLAGGRSTCLAVIASARPWTTIMRAFSGGRRQARHHVRLLGHHRDGYRSAKVISSPQQSPRRAGPSMGNDIWGKQSRRPMKTFAADPFQRDHRGRWLTSGNPAGRPRGSRNRWRRADPARARLWKASEWRLHFARLPLY
jgi:hypothetical protein